MLLWRLHRLARYERDAIALARELAQEDQQKSEEPQYPPELMRRQKFIERRVELLARLLGLPDDAPLSNGEATTIVAAAADMAGIDANTVLVPGVPEGVDMKQFQAWTVGLVRSAMGAIVTLGGQAPTAFLFSLVYAALYDKDRLEEAIRKAEIDTDRLRRERLLPDGDALNRVIRYEAHLHRQLLQTMHELEALQARRQGRQTPLAQVDV